MTLETLMLVPLTWRSLLLLTVAAMTACGARFAWGDDPNTLTPEEKQAGFELLFNGRDLHGWEPAMGTWSLEDVPWKVQDGAIYFQADLGFPSLVYARKPIPADFDLRFEWKEPPLSRLLLEGQLVMGTYGAMRQNGWTGRLFCGFHAGERDIGLYTEETAIPARFSGISRSAGPGKDNRRPAGQWNEARMICKGSLFQHWVNREKILEVDVRQEDWLKLENESGNPILDEWFKVRTRGLRLEIENTDVPVWYRRIRVRPIPGDEVIKRGTP